MKKEKNNNILKKVSQLVSFCAIINFISDLLCRKGTSDMNCEAVDMLKQIYSGTDIPVAIAEAADKKLNIIWQNPASENVDCFINCCDALISDEGECRNGTVSACIDGVSQLFNIIKYENGRCFYIIEYLGRDSLYYVSAMKNYFTQLCVRLRESAGQIVMSADDISMIVKSGGSDVASPLNRIDRNVMTLLNEAVVPEQIYCILDPESKDEVISLEQEVALAVSDAEKVFGRTSEVVQNEIENITISMNRSVLETILACMTVESCCGELFPDRIEFTVERISEERAFVSVRSINFSGKKNTVSKMDLFRHQSEFPNELFKKLLEEKYGASFEKKNYSDGIESVMTLKVFPMQNRIVKNGSKYALREERFSTMAVSLSEKHYGERYNNIKMK